MITQIKKIDPTTNSLKKREKEVARTAAKIHNGEFDNILKYNFRHWIAKEIKEKINGRK